MQNGTVGMGTDDRETTPDAGVHVPRPRAWAQDPGSAYRELFDAAANSPVAEVRTPRRPKRSRRQTRRMIVVALVVLLLVGAAVAGGLAWAAKTAKQPALDALRAGNEAFEPVAAGLRRADDLAGLRTAAEGANSTADRIDKAAEAVSSPSTNLERAVRDVLREEAVLLRSADEIAALQIETLGTWPAIRNAIGDAESALDADVERLSAVEPGAARQVRTGRGIAAHTDEVVADFASTSLVDVLETQLEGLTAAGTTADLRAVATSTAKSSEVVDLALEGVDASGDQGTRITRVGVALDAIAGLDTISGDKLGTWPAIRAKLVAATTGLEGVDARNALSAVDGLVARAAQQLKAWQTATAAATAKAGKDSAELTAYTTAVGAALTAKGKADQAAAAFLKQVAENAELTSQQAIAYLDSAAAAREAVRTALTDAAPTKSVAGLAPEHLALQQAADAAVELVKAGRAGTGKTKCGTVAPTTPGGKPTPAPCLYSATPGYAALSAGTASAAQDFAPLQKAWDEAVAKAQKAITDRTLPTKPVV